MKWCPIKFPYSLSIYQCVVYLCCPIKTSMVLRRMFQMVFEDKTPKDKVGMGWGKNANMQGVFLGIYDLNFLIRLLQQNVGLLACTDWSMGPFLISISNQAMAAKLHHIQSSMKNSLIGDLDQKQARNIVRKSIIVP